MAEISMAEISMAGISKTDMSAREASAVVELAPVDFARTFSLQRLGPHDPSASLSKDEFRKAFFFRGHAVALRFHRESDGPRPTALRVTAFGDPASDLLAETLTCLAQPDDYERFPTADAGIARLHRSLPGLRLLRVPWLWDIACSIILQQRIRTVDAMRAWSRLVARAGMDAPLGLRAFPSAAALAQIPGFALRPMEIDAQRAGTLLRLAREWRFLPLRAEMSFSQMREHLARIPGIGPWTIESILGYGAGDCDAAIPGDLHLPHLVCYALAGETRGSDQRMMELLEPFRGHRFRVIRLLYASRLVVPRS